MTDPEYYIVKPEPISTNIVEFAPSNCEDFTLHEIQVKNFFLIKYFYLVLKS